MDQPEWLDLAWAELGQSEIPGPSANARIRQYFKEAGHPGVVDDAVPWCAAFLGACLERAGEPGTGSLMARSYLDWGLPMNDARLGAVTVLSRGSDPALGHVGFLVGTTTDSLLLLGGNQGDGVSVAAFPKTALLGLRWPDGAKGTRSAGEPPDFRAALAHVLEMEGGYTEDPYDPGGPTNKGITLGVLATWRDVTLDASNYAELKEQLKAITADEVCQIYEARYWRPACCGQMPSGLALMHFDAAVNHGVGRATRLLQEAVGTDIDGEMGPKTRAAIAATPDHDALQRYAEIRRRRYRELPHFWRFGRGWLRRVDTTLARALERAIAAPSRSTSQQKGSSQMQTETAQQGTGKWWGESLTVWGALVTALSTVLPALGPVVGIDVTGELVQQAGQQIVQTVQALGGLIGTVLTIYGRARATQPLERRDLSVRL